MAKQNCAACGKEIGLIQQVQLSDMNYICRNCAKKTIPYFQHLNTSWQEYQDHQQQLADGEKLYNAYFKKNKKMKKYCGGRVLYDPATALVCINGNRGKILFFGGKNFYTVMRVADLDVYEKLSKFQKGSDGKNVEKVSMHMTFRNVQGIHDYALESTVGSIKAACKGFDEVFGGKGLIGGIKNSFKKNQAQAMAIAGMASGLKDAIGGMKGGAENADMASVETGAAQVAANMEAMFYAGREELMEKADAAIKAVLG